ncbi:Carbohydrate binding domain (family 15) [Alteromonadaceae bacterium Bs31]|nr:Carbohydrate binding domain (family 15) [Alteromonadaceae bacterium Bs31]
MLYRSLLISFTALGLAACSGGDYEERISGDITAPPPNNSETLPSSGVVVNGNLEDSETEATGWNGYANAGEATFELSTDQYYSGAQSYKITLGAVGENSWEIAAGPVGVPLEEDHTYYFSAWVLGTNGAIANFQAKLEEDPWTSLKSKQVDVTSSWQRVSFSFDSPPGVSTIQLPVEVSYAENAGAVIYLDHVSLVGAPKSGIVDIPIEDGLPGWSSDWRTNTLTYDADRGVVVEPDWANDDQIAMYILDAPMNFNGVTLNYVVDITQEFKDAGINLQPYVQQNSGSYDADWSGWVNNSDLSVGVNVLTYTPSAAPEDTQRVGIQVKGAGRSTDPSTFMSIMRVYYEGESGSDIPLDSGWSVSDGLEVDYNDGGVSYSPTEADHQLTYRYDGPQNFDGAVFGFTIVPDQAFIDSGAPIQPFAQLDSGAGAWSCWINGGTNLTLDGITYDCTIGGDGGFNFDASDSMRVGIQVKDSPAGTLTISNVSITAAE